MEVTEASQNPSKLFEAGIRGNLSNAARKQYLERARGNYVSALTKRCPDKKEETNIQAIVDVSSVLSDRVCDQVVEAEKPATPEHPDELKRYLEKDVRTEFSKELFEGSEKQLQTFKLHFSKTLSRSTAALLADTGNAKESQKKGMAESRHLQKTVKTLKAELENVKREHSESASKNSRLRNFHRKPENKAKRACEDVSLSKIKPEHLKIKAKGLKRELNNLKSYAQVEKRPRITLRVKEAKECTMNAQDSSKNLPERMYTTCVSTSKSRGKIMNSEDDLESSTLQPEKTKHLQMSKWMMTKGNNESYEDDHASKFSIRDFVFSSRSKDISKNWPFSRENLQLCLERGVTNVLPPFQPLYTLREGSVKRCLVEKSVSTEESHFDERPSVMKKCRWNQKFTEGYKDLESCPSLGDKDLGFQSTAGICESEVGSVSTSNLPLSEAVSDDQEASASAANKKKNPLSQIINKKCRITLKLPVNSRRGPSEDITSACMTPSEIMASKICPVCESFSSSSNTTLNAHIDQCLSSQSTSNWMKNTKVIVPKVKPQKIRSMVDICATAPSSTLEDLDKRNGSNWATNVEIPSVDTGLCNEEINHKVSTRHTVNNCDDGSVYIDSNGRKIRILSKFNEMAPSPFKKPREDPKVRKRSNKGKRSKLLAASRKRRLVKHLKYLRVTRQRRHFLSHKVKGHSAKASAVEEATYAVQENHMEHEQCRSFGKGLKNSSASETSSRRTPSKIITARKSDHEDTTEVCRYDLRPIKDLRLRNDQKDMKTSLKNHSHIANKPMRSIQRMGNTAIASADAACPKTIAPLKLRGPGFNAENTKECVWTSLDSDATSQSSLERESEIQPDAFLNTANPKLLHSCSQDGLIDSAETCHGNNDSNDPVSSTSLTDRDTDSRLNPSFEPESQKVADVSVSAPVSKLIQCTDEFQSPLSTDESNGYFFQRGTRDGQNLYGDVSGSERSELKMRNTNFSFGQESFSTEIDPILIPGPPGYDLPSFSDMGSEDDEDDVINKDSSNSCLAATSTMFNMGVTVDHIYPGCSPMDTLTVLSQSTDAKSERNVSFNDLEEFPGKDQQCFRSQKEVVPWSSTTTIQDSQFQEDGLVKFPKNEFSNSVLTEWPFETVVNSVETSYQNIRSLKVCDDEAGRPRKASDCDSASPAPVLRLMGKNLMVPNNNEVDPSMIKPSQNIFINRQVNAFTENSSFQIPGLIQSLPSEQNPHFFSAQCFDVGASSMVNNFRRANYTSADGFVNQLLPSSFTVPGAPFLQRLRQA